MAERIDSKWAWAEYKPSADNPWDLRKAGHLYRRAEFGASWPTLKEALANGPAKTIDGLLKSKPETKNSKDTAEILDRGSRQNINTARGWWLTRMLDGSHPLREKMTLFWHNHFATSNAKVQNAGRMFGQYELMHRYALGNFSDLLQDMSKDPAMMVWLDTIQSKKGQPNENYARELMELFSLGIGNYSEQDIREAAKAFTGWEIKSDKFNFNSGQYDGSQKTVLGKSGRLKGEDIVDICLAQRACPRFITRKLLRFLVSDSLPLLDDLIDPLANSFRDSKFHFGNLVETVLRSNLFFSHHAYRNMIKSPVDFALGIKRGLEVPVSTSALAVALETLGQNLFHPPSVKGWDGGQTWLNGQTLLFRQNLALALSSRDVKYVKNSQDDENTEPLVIEPADLLRKYGIEGEDATVKFLLELFLQGDVASETRDKLVVYLKQARKQSLPVYWTAEERERHPTRAVTHLVLTLPEFQLG